MYFHVKKDVLNLVFRLKNVQTPEELRDVHTHFLLYYSGELPDMQRVARAKARKRELEEKK